MPRDKERDRVYQLERYRKLRAETLSFLGGKCSECESTDDLQIDHIDPATKALTSSQWGVAKKRLLEEVAKCQLLCRSCHKKKTSTEQRKGHGTWGMYRRKCRCRVCKDFVRDYARERRMKGLR